MSRVNRIVVVGISGSGKTTVAKVLSETLGLPHLEMDAVMHDGGWNATSDAEFRQRIDEFTRGDRWVVDGNYTSHGAAEIIWPRADTCVWIDPSKPVVMWRVVSRTLRRMVTGERLWGGLTEPISNLYKLDPYQNVIVWAWTRFEPTREKFEAAATDGSWDHSKVHRLRTRREFAEFLSSTAM